jgi:hypothetical protein
MYIAKVVNENINLDGMPERLKHFNDALNRAYELKERWNNRLTFEGLSISKRYL